eukprot:242985_1
MAQDEMDKGTIVVWGKEAQKTRFINIHGQTDVKSLLQAVTGTSLQHLSFFDENGIRFGDVTINTKVKDIGQFDEQKRLWIVTIIPKQKEKSNNSNQSNENKNDEKEDIEISKIKLIQRWHTSHNNVIYSEQNPIKWDTNNPQNDQGIEALMLKIKPTFKHSTLKIHANLIGRREANISMAALFRSDNINSVYSTCNNGTSGWFVPIIFDYEMKSDVVDEIVISIRISGYALNGRKNNSTVFNGTMSSTLIVEEYV